MVLHNGNKGWRVAREWNWDLQVAEARLGPVVETMIASNIRQYRETDVTIERLVGRLERNWKQFQEVHRKQQMSLQMMHLDNITWGLEETMSHVWGNAAASIINNRKWEVLPVSPNVGFDRKESLFNRIEIWWIRRKKDKFAHGLIFNQSLNFFRVVNVTIVEDKYTSRARVGVGEWNDQLTEELNKSLWGDRPRDNVVRDDAINGENGEDGKPLSMNKKPVLDALPSHSCPAFCSPWGFAIPSSLINKHKHIEVLDCVSNGVHICGTKDFISFYGPCWDTFAADIETLKCMQKCGDGNLATTLLIKCLLDLI
jgi:hypothetical protein